MKKIILLLSVVSLILYSCSSDADSLPLPVNQTNTDSVFLKKTVDSDGTIYNYTYNGDKIVSIIDNDVNEPDDYFTYSGDLITKIESKLDGNVEDKDVFEYYSDGKLKTYLYFDYGLNWGNKREYTYNNDGTVSYTHYVGDTATQTLLNNTGKIFFTNGEIIRHEIYPNIIGALTNTTTYTYDNKNNPMKNVLGLNKIVLIDSELFLTGFLSGINQNVLSVNRLGIGLDPTVNINYSYVYNSNNYPKSFTETDNGVVLTTECFY